MTELAFKFTRPGARSPFTGYAWPQGEWVEVEGEVGLCANGIHACRPEALPRWLDDELWRIEVDDVHEELDGVLVARRGRLVERIGAWNAEASRELARSCARRARELAAQHSDPRIHAMADDIAATSEGPDPSATALSMYCTAHAFDVAVTGGYDAERRRQADWIRDRLGLGD
jgi:hypothetical protein